MKKNQKGFGVIEVILAVILVALVCGAGWFVYSKHHKTTAAPTTATADSKPAASTQVTPTAFVKELLGTLSSDNESSLVQLLTHTFESFRQSNLAAGPCNGAMTPALTCTSVLNIRAIDSFASMTPAVADYAFKNGQTGKTVTYEDTTNYIDPTYLTFYLLPHGNSWLLNDYADLDVPSGSAFSVNPGTMESQ